MADAALSIAPVTDADRAAVEAYLAARSDTCLFLRSNLRDAGLSWSPPRGALGFAPVGHHAVVLFAA